MKTVGQLLLEARIAKAYSQAHLEGKTKIKKDFLDALEKEQWQLLPEYPVVRGFVKSIADALELDSNQALAFLRRDYPPQKLPVSPKPDISTKFVWTPRLTFLTGAAIVLLVILGYLGLQYIKFSSPPMLEVAKPSDQEIVRMVNLEVIGKTSPGATIKINNQPTIVLEDGSFKTEIEVNDQTKEVEVVSESRSGKKTFIKRSIDVQLKN